MDALLITSAIKKKKEEGVLKATQKETSSGSLSSIFSLIVGVVAVYLSWSCNTKQGVGTLMKIFYAFFAAIFGIIYLIYYAIFNMSKCPLSGVGGIRMSPVV